jgi:hypothetical protein
MHAVLFDIMQYLIKVVQMKSKKLEFDNLNFSSKTLKYIFGDKLKDETFKQDLVKKIKNLISDQYFEVKGESMYLTQKAITYFYIIE